MELCSNPGTARSRPYIYLSRLVAAAHRVSATLTNTFPVPPCQVVHRAKAERMGRALCAKMKELLARQQADVAVQAAANNRIVARETIKACFDLTFLLLPL